MNGNGPETRIRSAGTTIAGSVAPLAGISTRGICDQLGGAGRPLGLPAAGAVNCWGRLKRVAALPQTGAGTSCHQQRFAGPWKLAWLMIEFAGWQLLLHRPGYWQSAASPWRRSEVASHHVPARWLV